LLASRIEAVPLVMLEAMALGIPVVASDLPGTRGYLPAECLFPIGDLSRAMDLIQQLRDPEFRGLCIKKNQDRYQAAASGTAFSENTRQLAPKLIG
jgi:glycosyltransferase involved in cell wall biosynthesis